MLFEKREKHKTLLKNPLSELFKSKLSTEKIIQTKHKTKHQIKTHQIIQTK